MLYNQKIQSGCGFITKVLMHTPLFRKKQATWPKLCSCWWIWLVSGELEIQSWSESQHHCWRIYTSETCDRFNGTFILGFLHYLGKLGVWNKQNVGHRVMKAVLRNKPIILDTGWCLYCVPLYPKCIGRDIGNISDSFHDFGFHINIYNVWMI